MFRHKVVGVLRDVAVLSLLLLTGVAIRLSMMGPWLG
jgi:hypothetical protein